MESEEATKLLPSFCPASLLRALIALTMSRASFQRLPDYHQEPLTLHHKFTN